MPLLEEMQVGIELAKQSKETLDNAIHQIEKTLDNIRIAALYSSPVSEAENKLHIALVQSRSAKQLIEKLEGKL